MRYLQIDEAIKIHDAIIQQSGGLNGIRDMAVLGFSLISNHPFLDGNKRIGHAAMEIFLILNGYQLEASVDLQEEIILQVASGSIDLNTFKELIKPLVQPIKSPL